MIGYILSLYLCASVDPGAVCSWTTHPQVYATQAECQTTGEGFKAKAVVVIGAPNAIVTKYRCKPVKF